MAELTQEEISERIEHRDALLNIRAILGTAPGRDFFKYLFKTLEVGEFPVLGIEGAFLHDRLGFLRVGKEIFKLVAEADADMAATLLAHIEKERYAKLYADSNIGQS